MKKLNSLNLNCFFRIHFPIIIGLAVLSLLFYYPLLTGKVLVQSDIRQYEGMSRQLKEYRAETGQETYWIDNAYGGMPTYQLGAEYPRDFLSPLYNFIRILPRPAHILFLYFLGVYILLTVLNYPWYYSLFGSMAYGFSTYLLIILQVGHNTKALAISFFAFVLAGLMLLFQKRYLWGFFLSTLALGMQIRANHYQMTYYLLMLVGIFCLGYGYQSYREKTVMSFTNGLLLFVVAGILALGLNATPLLTTVEYSEFSTRGKSELKFLPDGSPKEQSSGLDYDYITEYSYGIFESLNLIVPRIQGGGSSENLGKNHGLYDFLVENGVSQSQASQFTQQVPTYWGNQPILEAPAYIGITIFFFALLGFLYTKGTLRNVLTIGALFSLVLSWGKNFSFLTDFFVSFFPLYNKFRAVSSIQVILELCFPLLAVMGLHWSFSDDKKWEQRRFFSYVGVTLLFFLFLLLLKSILSFSGINDAYFEQIYGDVILDKIKEARISIFETDLLRAIIFVTILAALVWTFRNSQIKRTVALGLVFLVLLIDLLGISSRYIDRESFIPKTQQRPFAISAADQAILQDSSRYRVLEPQLGLTGARTSFFHNAIGGYHGAKPRRFEELFDYYQSNQVTGVLDILNVKYILYNDPDSKQLKPMRNSNALGIAWPVYSLKELPSADALLQNLENTDFKYEALFISGDIPKEKPLVFDIDSLSKISISKAKPDKLVYNVSLTKDQFFVFSEMYYPKGWDAKIDGEITQIYNVNYVLRGLYVPAQSKVIEFEFSPPIVDLGTSFRGVSLILFIVILFFMLYSQYRKRYLGF